MALVDKVVDKHGTREVAQAYLDYLYSPEGQEIIAKNYYRPRLHKGLLTNQQPGGAWLGGDGYGPAYGTAMSVLALTVEYRFLPIYQRGEEPSDK